MPSRSAKTTFGLLPMAMACSLAVLLMCCVVPSLAQTPTPTAPTGGYSPFPGKMEFDWTMEGETTLRGTLKVIGDYYGSFGISGSGMSGKLVLCHFSLSATAAQCRDYIGSNWAVTPHTAQYTTVTQSYRKGTAFTVEFTVDAKQWGVGSKGSGPQRVIFAYGSMVNGVPQEHPSGGDVAANIDFYTAEVTPIKKSNKNLLIAIVVCGPFVIAWLVACLVATYKEYSLSAKRQMIFVVTSLLVFVLLVPLGVFAKWRDNKANGKPEPLPLACGQILLGLFYLLFVPLPRLVAPLRLIGMSFDRAVFYHTIVGFLVVLMSLAHGIGMWIEHGWDKMISTNGKHPILPVFVYLIILVFVVLPVALLRRKMFSIFLFSHMLWGVLGGLAVMHVGSAAIPVFGFLFFYAVDSLLRMFFDARAKPRITSASYDAEAETTKLVVKFDGPKFAKIFLPEPGQYAFLAISGLSPQSHPISIAARTSNTATFYVKAVGPWTKALAASVKSGNIDGKTITVDGPYGKLMVPINASGIHVMLFAGGIGVTPMLSLLQHVAETDVKYSSVSFHWVLRDVSMLHLVKAELSEFQQRWDSSAANKDTPLTFRVHVTRGKQDPADPSKLPQSVEIASGRPDVEKIVSAQAQKASDAQPLCVYCCGPAQLMDSVASAARSNPCTKLHSETFNF